MSDAYPPSLNPGFRPAREQAKVPTHWFESIERRRVAKESKDAVLCLACFEIVWAVPICERESEELSLDLGIFAAGS